jgi:cellulose biosynthesis protein BcsQ
MDQAMHRQQSTGHRLGFIIAAMGLLDRAQLRGILSLHVMESLHKVSEMSSTTIHFKETDESAEKKDYPDLVDISQLLTEKLLFSRDLPAIDAGIEELIIELGDHLSLLPSGSIPPNPSELVGSSHLEFILSRLKKKFDFIIIDSPPILPASDALLLTPNVDGVCLVVKASHLNRTMIDRASAMIKETQANLLGVILNEIDAKRDGYYSYYQKYYGD